MAPKTTTTTGYVPPASGDGRTPAEKYKNAGSGDPTVQDPRGAASASGLDDYKAVDVTEIFGGVTTRDGSVHRISISGNDLNGLMGDPARKLYVRRVGDSFLFSLTNAGGGKLATPAIAAQFGRNSAGRREGLLRLQYYMQMSGAYSAQGQQGGPTLGTWGAPDYQALTNVLSNLQFANVATGTGKNGTAVSQLSLGKFLKDQTEKAIALAKDAAKRSASSGGGANIRVTDTAATGSALDDQFQQLTGRSATKSEKDSFIKAFRDDELSAGRANAANVAPSQEQQTATQLQTLTAQYEQGKVDPLVRFEHQWVRASDVPAAGRGAIATKYGVDYSAIAKFYKTNPMLTMPSSGGGGSVIEQPSLAARADAAAKASPDYMPFQVGTRGQRFLDAITNNRPFGSNPDIRSG